MDNLRLTAGLGWGRLSSNSDRVISNTGDRGSSSSYLGGTLNYERFFKGNVASFGGFEYQTPINSLRLKAEISSDDYSFDNYLSTYRTDNNYNYGIDYDLNNTLNISAYYLNESELGLRFKISANPENSPGNFMEPVPQPFYSSPIPEKDLSKNYIEELKETLNKEKIFLISSSQIGNNQIVVIEQKHYSTNTQAIGRTLRIMSRFVPIKYNKFTVVVAELGIPIVEITVDRNEIASIVDAPNSELLSLKAAEINSAKSVYKNSNPNYNNKLKYDWSILPYYRLHLFDPDKPIYYDFGPRLRARILPKPGLMISASLEKSVVSSFDRIWRGAKGSLPHVRTNMKEYLNVLDERIEYLTMSSYFKLQDEVYGRITAGYLEPMYAGISSEILFSPINKNYAFGAEINTVKAREFRQLFGFREIDGLSKINGHLSGYLDTGFYYYKSQFDVGKYLAGDIGATLKLSRNFPNGWKVGGFFTLTDAGFQEFGEGSFDKGIFLTIPYNSILPYQTTGSVSETIKPIQGDGGARLIVNDRLYKLVNDKSKKSLKTNWARIWR